MISLAMPKPKDQRITQPREGATKARKPDAAFDLWLQRGLHEIYDTVAAEPVPDALLRLIEEDRNK